MRIELKDVCKEYVKKKRRIKVIDNLNYVFESGNMYLIKGSSGTGKTTLLSIIGLLDKENSGQIIFDDRIVSQASNKDKTKIRNEEIGFIFQDYNLLEGLTIEENIKLIYLDSNVNSMELDKKISDLLGKMNLSHRKGHFPFELSGGEKQRVGIARALIKEPKLVICDEPISNLDKTNSNQIIDILKDLKNRQDCIILVSCHTSDFDEVADEIIEF